MEKQNNSRAFFITIEGPEGAGKSTQAAMLAEELQRRGYPVKMTREPGGTPLAEELRSVIKSYHGHGEKVHDETELLLIEAARAQHVRELIQPALEAGTSVICDRFYDSTSAYQGGGRGLPQTLVDELNAFAVGKCVPDLTFLLDLDPERGFERIAHRQETAGEYDRFEAEKLAFHRTLRESFLRLAAREPRRIKVIDADRTAEAIFNNLRGYIDELVR